MPAETPLTARQQEIWQFLVTYVDDHGYPPTVREIGEEVGLASPSTVHAHLANLERVGLIRRDPSKPRAIELTGHRRVEAPAATDVPRLPLLGRVAAGGRCSRRRTSRTSSRSRVDRPRGRLPAHDPRRLDDRGGHPRRRHDRRAAPRRRAERRRRRRARGRRRVRRRGDGEDLPTARPTAGSASSRRTRRSSRSTPTTSRSSARSWGCSGACDDRRRRQPSRGRSTRSCSRSPAARASSAWRAASS